MAAVFDVRFSARSQVRELRAAVRAHRRTNIPEILLRVFCCELCSTGRHIPATRQSSTAYRRRIRSARGLSYRDGPSTSCGSQGDIGRRLSCGSAADLEDRRDEPYDSFKIISKKALADYHRAEERFVRFLDEADVWSHEQVRSSRLATCGWHRRATNLFRMHGAAADTRPLYASRGPA